MLFLALRQIPNALGYSLDDNRFLSLKEILQNIKIYDIYEFFPISLPFPDRFPY